jgi:hypothetical protein
MRRPAKGGTTRPVNVRPGNGYGRPLRPSPDRDPEPRPWLDPEWWSAIEIDAIARAEVGAERS